MMASSCPTCRGTLAADDRFCGSCGAAASATVAGVAPPVASTRPAPSPARARAAEPAVVSAGEVATVATPRIPARFWNRLAAWLIDFLILSLIGAPLVLLGGGSPWAGAYLAVSILSIVYRPLMWHFRNGQTIGQQAMKICAVKDDGTNLSIGRGVWRVLATWITGFIPIVGRFNVLSMLWNDERRCWFDRWSDTRVDSRADPRRLGFFKRD
jgi:uncharacterized RDD family membrane protein YckC